MGYLDQIKVRSTGTIYDIADSTARSSISDIEDVIPSTASSSNQLVDDASLSSELSGYIESSEKGSANGVAELDSAGKVPSSQLPSYVDDVVEAYIVGDYPLTAGWLSDSAHGEALTPEASKIYVIMSEGDYENRTYRWGTSTYVEISESLALGETSSTAYAGNKGKANADAIAAIKDGSTIDSFADVEDALAGKQDELSFDTTPTSGSTNPVTSNGIYNAILFESQEAREAESALDERVSVTEDDIEELNNILSTFSGSQAILDSSGDEILDSSDEYVLDTQIGAAGLVVTVNNIVSWFKSNLNHLIQDSGYTATKAEYELINS